jgi:hypothetical protein
MTDLDGVETIDFTYEATGVSFETILLDGPDRVVCSGIGGVTADSLSYGTATLNGESGYGYLLETEDNREEYGLCASLTQSPRNRDDAVVVFSPPRMAVVPAILEVLSGGAGSGTARLVFDDIKCRYRGDGVNYVFDRCTGPGGRDILPGDNLSVSKARLRIQRSDNSYNSTSIRATPFGQYGAPDYFSLIIFSPGSTHDDVEVVHTWASDVTCGDIDIDLK